MSSSQDRVKNRLRRVSSQVDGLERMVEEERCCIDILTQISAARAALDKVALELLGEHRHCMVGAKNQADREEQTEEMLDAVTRPVRSR